MFKLENFKVKGEEVNKGNLYYYMLSILAYKNPTHYLLMKVAFRKALKLFKQLSILFSVGYCIYIILDDYYFIERYWSTNWSEYILVWVVYYFFYFILCSFYYWSFTVAVIFLYHKFINPTSKNSSTNDLNKFH